VAAANCVARHSYGRGLKSRARICPRSHPLPGRSRSSCRGCGGTRSDRGSLDDE
jgi:hypothetical protein